LMDRKRSGVLSRPVEPRLAAVLCYLLGIVTGILLLTIEKDSRFVRFHALQSIVYSAAVIVALAAFAMAGLRPVSALLGIAAFGGWLWLMYRAALGEWYELPWLGWWAERNA